MAYYEFIVETSDEAREAVIERLSLMGAIGFVELDGKTIAYFQDGLDPSDLCKEIDQFRDVLEASGLDPSLSFEYAKIPDKDWNELWKKQISALDIGQRMTIVPPWLSAGPGRMDIVIDPGMAFGTGHHDTTCACLMLIERLSEDASGSLLDVGTGTGILAIAASRLGFGRVVAVDTDPVAVDAAIRNVALNGLNNVEVRQCGIRDVSGRFDVITANLIAETLIEEAGEIAARLMEGGHAVISGMLPGEEAGVMAAMSNAGLALIEKIDTGRWVTILYRSSR